MNKETFKAGDAVYCPTFNARIHVLHGKNGDLYKLIIKDGTSYDERGNEYTSDPLPRLFHATPENKALLEALYKCEFESPKLKGSDLTRKLLSEGKHVLCGLSVHGDGAAGNGTFVGLIVRFEDGRFIDGSNNPWSNAVPCNDYANLPDGVLTLKSEQ